MVYDDISVILTGYSLVLSGMKSAEETDTATDTVLGIYIIEYGVILIILKYMVTPLWQNVALIHKKVGQ